MARPSAALRRCASAAVSERGKISGDTSTASTAKARKAKTDSPTAQSRAPSTRHRPARPHRRSMIPTVRARCGPPRLAVGCPIVSTAISLVLLIAVLGFAVVRPRGLPEAVGAVPAAVLTVVAGLVPWRNAVRELADLGPTVGFLAAVLLLAYLADRAGVFRFAGAVAARWSGGSPRRLLGIVFVIAAAVTAALSLDATVVLLTPVVFATASALAV